MENAARKSTLLKMTRAKKPVFYREILFICFLSVLVGTAFSLPQNGGIQAQDEKMIVACVGDSITYGYGVRHNLNLDSYPAILQRKLGDNYQVLNFGVSNSALTYASYNPYWETDSYYESMVSNPNIVLIMLGTNDTWHYRFSADLFEGDLMYMISLYQSLPSQPTVYLLTPPDAFSIADGEVIENELVPLIHKIGEQAGVEVIDIFPLTKDQKKYYISDAIHPNAFGNYLISKLVFKAITN